MSLFSTLTQRISFWITRSFTRRKVVRRRWTGEPWPSHSAATLNRRLSETLRIEASAIQFIERM